MNPQTKLFNALAGFQQEVPVILKDTQATNAKFSYTYADLPAILAVINPLLKKYGMGFTQLIDGEILKTVVFHTESGESIESTIPIPQNIILLGQNPLQVMGSAITYLRRYSLSAMLGLVTDKDTDAQGEQVESKPKTGNAKKTLDITDVTFAKALAAVGEGRYSVERIMKKYHLSPEAEKMMREAENSFKKLSSENI